MNSKSGNIERRRTDKAEVGRMSRFGQILLNQGAVEQNFIDHLCAKSNIRVEWNTRAESLQITADDEDREAFPVAVGVACLDEHGVYFKAWIGSLLKQPKLILKHRPLTEHRCFTDNSCTLSDRM